MRRIFWRSIIGGVFFMILAVVFYFIMLANVSASTDPAELMRLTGQISGFVIAVGVLLIIRGFIGTKS
jgi:hypothetical protein